MECRETGEMLLAYVDGELGAETKERLTRHLARCASCAAELAAWKSIDQEVRALPSMDPGPDFARQVAARADGWDFFTGGPAGSRTVLATLRELLGELMDLIGQKRAATTRTLDEFDDCPPLSMGSVYFRIIGESGRG